MHRNSPFQWMLSLGLLLSCVPTVTRGGDGLRDALVYPSSNTPETVGTDRILDLHVTLRLPLTPPPGVQQSAAVKDWRVVLKSDTAWTPGGKKEFLEYTLPVMRIRPLKSDTYRFQVELPPWLPDGQYDTMLLGPGVKVSATKSVRLIGRKNHGPTVSINQTAAGELFLINQDTSPLQGTFQIVLSKQEPGISVIIEQVPTPPLSVAFAHIPIDGTRVLTYAVTVPAATAETPGRATVRLKPESPVPCSGEILLSPAAPNDATAYRDIRFTSTHPPHTVIWDFSDGRFGTGNPVRHRFLLTNEADITAWALDAEGRICTASTDAALNELSDMGGCSCIAVGR